MTLLHLTTPNSPGGTGKRDYPPLALCNRTVSKHGIARDITFTTCPTCFRRAAVGYRYDNELGKHIQMDDYDKALEKWDTMPNNDVNGGRKRDVAIIRDVMGFTVTSQENGSYTYCENGLSEEPIPHCESQYDFMMYVQSCTVDELGAAKYIPILARSVGINTIDANNPTFSVENVGLLLDASIEQIMKSVWIAFQIYPRKDDRQTS